MEQSARGMGLLAFMLNIILMNSGHLLPLHFPFASTVIPSEK